MKVLLAVIVAAATYIGVSSSSLPPRVASHFGEGGVPDDFMSREAYVAFMLGLAVALPLLVAASARLFGRLPISLVNLPHKAFWLAPERRAQTLAWLGSRTAIYAATLPLFFAYIHWLVLEANTAATPRLAEGPFLIGVGVFVAVTLLWTVALMRRFRRPA